MCQVASLPLNNEFMISFYRDNRVSFIHVRKMNISCIQNLIAEENCSYILVILITIIAAIAIPLVCCFIKWKQNNSDISLQSETYTKNIVAIDCEFVACTPTKQWLAKAPPKQGKRNKNKKNKKVHVAAHCAIVGYNGDKIFKDYICHDMFNEYDEDDIDWRGLDPNKVKQGKSFERARKEILAILKGKLVVLHDIKHDLRSLQIHLVRDIPLEKIRDSSTCCVLRQEAGMSLMQQNVELKKLYKCITRKVIQRRTPHDPIEDASATMELYRLYENEWEQEIKKTGYVSPPRSGNDTDSD